VKREKDLTKEL